MLIVLAGRCGCLCWVDPRFFWRKFKFSGELHGFEFAAVAVNRLVFFLEIGSDGYFGHTGWVMCRQVKGYKSSRNGIWWHNPHLTLRLISASMVTE